MQTINLNIKEYQSLEELVGYLRTKDIQRGDTVKVKSFSSINDLMSAGLLLLLAIGLLDIFDKRNRNNFGQKVIDGIFEKSMDVIDFEKAIAEEYGIQIELEPERDEIKPAKHKTGISSLKGRLQPESSEAIDKQLQKLREEWQRDI